MRKPPRRNSVGHFLLCVAADARRYEGKWWKHRGFWAVLSYRLRLLRKRGPWYCKALIPLDALMTFVRVAFSHCEIPAAARIGPGLFLPHPDGVILGDGCRIGSDVAIFQQVTLGCWKTGSPIIRSRAVLFSGAKVIGRAVVGRGACAGANAVVTKDIPAGYVATGVPAVARPQERQIAAPVNGRDVRTHWRKTLEDLSFDAADMAQSMELTSRAGAGRSEFDSKADAAAANQRL